jgi:signal transduction histidine kinase/Tfp pilus assembly protein PilF
MEFKRFIKYLVTILIFILAFNNCTSKESSEENAINNLMKELEKVDAENISNYDFIKIDSLLRLSKRRNYFDGIAKAYSLKGSFYYYLQEFDVAYRNYKAAVETAKLGNNYNQLGIDYENLGRVYNRLKNRDSSVHAFKRSAEVRRLINDSTGVGVAFHNAGFIFWQYTQYDSAIYYFEKALEIRKNLPNKEHLASTINNIGTIYYQWSIYDRALEYYFKSLELNREIGEDRSIAINLVNIGLVYKETSKNDRAVKFYKEGLPYALAAQDTQTIGYVYNSLASSFLEIDQDSSVFYFKKSLDAYEKINSTGGIIISYKGLAENAIRKKNYTQAKKYFYEILTLAKNDNNRLRIAESYKFLGEVNLAEGKLIKAKEYFIDCIEISSNLNLRGFLGLSKTYEELGQIDSALSSLKKYEVFNAEINNEDTKRRIDDLRTKFEFEKFQKQIEAQKYDNETKNLYLVSVLTLLFFVTIISIILFRTNKKRKKVNALLKQKNELIEGQSQQLEITNKELVELNNAKDKLFSIIAHDLKNPFSTLLNYSYFLKEEYADLSEKERLEFVSYMYQTTTKTYELLENLLNLSASRTGKIAFTPDNIEINLLIEKVAALYNSQLKEKNIELKNNFNNSIKSFADPYMIEIVLRNLLNNAIKYTPVNGLIEISSEINNGRVCISVIDNGIGMDDETVNNIFNISVIKSQTGTKGERGTGLGLGLCKEFVEQNNGKIFVESVLNKGSIFKVCLPTAAPI